MTDAVALLPGTVEQLIARTLRVPAFDGPEGNGEVVTRQLDVALLSEGFVELAELLAHLAGLEPGAAFDAAARIVGGVKRRVGSRVEANPYVPERPFPTAGLSSLLLSRVGSRVLGSVALRAGDGVLPRRLTSPRSSVDGST